MDITEQTAREHYKWNDAGQLLKRTLTGFRDQPLVQSYQYDALGRLTQVDCPEWHLNKHIYCRK